MGFHIKVNSGFNVKTYFILLHSFYFILLHFIIISYSRRTPYMSHSITPVIPLYWDFYLIQVSAEDSGGRLGVGLGGGIWRLEASGEWGRPAVDVALGLAHSDHLN